MVLPMNEKRQYQLFRYMTSLNGFLFVEQWRAAFSFPRLRGTDFMFVEELRFSWIDANWEKYILRMAPTSLSFPQNGILYIVKQ